MYKFNCEHEKLIKTLKETCRQKGYSYYYLAKRAGISTSTMYNIMNGKTDPQFFTLVTLCNVLEISFMDIIDIKSAHTCISEVEKELLFQYRNLSDRKKEMLSVYMEMLMQYREE